MITVAFELEKKFFHYMNVFAKSNRHQKSLKKQSFFFLVKLTKNFTCNVGTSKHGWPALGRFVFHLAIKFFGDKLQVKEPR